MAQLDPLGKEVSASTLKQKSFDLQMPGLNKSVQKIASAVMIDDVMNIVAQEFEALRAQQSAATSVEEFQTIRARIEALGARGREMLLNVPAVADQRPGVKGSSSGNSYDEEGGLTIWIIGGRRASDAQVNHGRDAQSWFGERSAQAKAAALDLFGKTKSALSWYGDNLMPAAIVWNMAASAVDRSGIVPMFNNASDWMWNKFDGTALGQSGIGRRYREVGQIRLSGMPKWNTGAIVNGVIPDTTRIPEVGIQGNQLTWTYGAARKIVNIGSGTLNTTVVGPASDLVYVASGYRIGEIPALEITPEQVPGASLVEIGSVFLTKRPAAGLTRAGVGGRFAANSGNMRPLGGRGPATAWEGFDETLAGGPVRDFTTDRIRVTPRGIEVVEKHTSRFGFDDANDVMIGRLRKIQQGEIPATQQDLNFYSHEFREYVRYRKLGWENGVPSNPDQARQLWLQTHSATLGDYNLPLRSDGLLYHPDALKKLYGE